MIMGQVLQAGAGQITARQAAVAAGIPMTTPAVTVNKVCLSGLDAIALADQLIRAGEFDIVVAGGMESMTNAPHLLMGQRQGKKYGDILVRDHTAFDGLTRPLGRHLDGRVHRAQRRRPRHHPGRAGRVRRAEPPAGRRGAAQRPLRRGDRRRSGPGSATSTR